MMVFNQLVIQNIIFLIFYEFETYNGIVWVGTKMHTSNGFSFRLYYASVFSRWNFIIYASKILIKIIFKFVN